MQSIAELLGVARVRSAPLAFVLAVLGEPRPRLLRLLQCGLQRSELLLHALLALDLGQLVGLEALAARHQLLELDDLPQLLLDVADLLLELVRTILPPAAAAAGRRRV